MEMLTHTKSSRTFFVKQDKNLARQLNFLLFVTIFFA